MEAEHAAAMCCVGCSADRVHASFAVLAVQHSNICLYVTAEGLGQLDRGAVQVLSDMFVLMKSTCQ